MTDGNNELPGEFGKINPNAPQETAQFAFIAGEWDMAVAFKQANGAIHDYRATFRCHWIVDGFVMQQDWKGPYAKGSEFRAYDPAQKKWCGHSIYAGSSWLTTEGEFKDGNMIIFILNAKDQTGEFINRETYHSITKTSFKIKSERSYDGGKNWVDGVYSMEAKRVR